MIKKIVMMFFMIVPLSLWSQLSISVDCPLDSVGFGDEVTFSYKINVPAGVDLTSIDFSSLLNIENGAYRSDTVNLDEIIDVDIVDGGAFGITNANAIVTKPSDGTPIPTTGDIKVRLSTIGAFLLPIPKLGHFSNAEEVPLQRKPLYVLPRQAAELNANKPIIEEDSTWWDYGKYALIWLGVLALGGYLYYLLDKKKKKEFDTNVEQAPVIKRPAHEIAIDELTLLQTKELWQNGEEKAYHTELTRIMRQYVEDRYDVQALEMTTSQLQRSMKEQGISGEIISRFTDILLIADKVKFAKGKTGPQINEQFMNQAIDIVDETKQIKQIEDNVE